MRNSCSAAVTAFLSIGYVGSAMAQAQVSGNAFNPAISVILNGKYTHYSEDPANYALTGFPLGEEAGLASEGFALDETELVISANVDDKYYGSVTAALVQEDGETAIEIEEAFIETLALPQGLKLKAGKFLADIGYLNPVHAHAWDFADAPLAYTALLNQSYSDTGVQLRWVAPTILFFEIGGELLRGDAFPAAGAANQGTGTANLFARFGGDLAAGSSWRAGISRLDAEANNRLSTFAAGNLMFTGTSDIWAADFVWKWAKNGNARDRSVVIQAEYLSREESGDIAVELFSGDNESGTYTGNQNGFYIQGVYQYRPRWRVGLRYDRLHASNTIGISLPNPLDAGSAPKRLSVMTDFSNSEFSRLRLQFNRDQSRGRTDNQIFVQYLMSLGAHGAHRF